MRHLILLLSFCTLQLACSSSTAETETKNTNGEPVSNAPDTRPDDLIVETGEGGGMNGDFTSVYISKDSSYYIIGLRRISNKLYFDLTDAELDELYQFLKDNHFDKIKSKDLDEVVHDQGSTSITIRHGGERTYATSGGGTRIAGKYGPNFGAIVSKLNKLAQDKTADQKKEYTITLDESMFGHGKRFYLSFETHRFGYNSEDTIFKKELTLDIYNGDHQFQCGLLNPDPKHTGGSALYFATGHFDLKITDTNRSGKLYFEEGKVVFKEE
jgi:hypothetical protein